MMRPAHPSRPPGFADLIRVSYSLRRIVKDKGAFPNDEAISELLWLGLREASKKWKRPLRDWKAALNQFAILYEDRVPTEQSCRLHSLADTPFQCILRR